jgi:hypothetical protein
MHALHSGHGELVTAASQGEKPLSEEAALRYGLEELVEAEILFVRDQPPTLTYEFKHALFQEAAYGSLLKRTRRVPRSSPRPGEPALNDVPPMITPEG